MLSEADLLEGRYNGLDCCRTWEVEKKLQAQMERMVEGWPKLPEVIEFQQKLFWPVLWAMDKGLRVDLEKKKGLSKELASRTREMKKELGMMVGHELNVNSPAQMKDFFYGDLRQPLIFSRGGKGKKKSPTLGEEALIKIGEREALLKPLVQHILLLRSVAKFKSSFIDAEVDVDGKMRTSFKIAGTKNYRFASSQSAWWNGMNFQNLPKGDEDGESKLPNVRGMFVPDPGYEFFDIDLDSADLRIVAFESNCLEMKQWLREGKKVYVEVAKEYYKDPSITKNHWAYRLFKSLCHGTNYLGEAKGLAGRLGLSELEVVKIQRWYFGKFPEILEWHEKVKAQVREKRFVENVFGYRMWYAGRVEEATFRDAVAAIPQSTVGCLINRGWMNLWEGVGKKGVDGDVEVLLQVHDSLGGQFKEEKQEMKEEVVRACTVPLKYEEGDCLIPVGFSCSKESWGACR